jgi:hypothetical protein
MMRKVNVTTIKLTITGCVTMLDAPDCPPMPGPFSDN